MSEPTYHLVMDAGGTKVAAVLYDEEFRLISTHRVGSFRMFTTPDELVVEHMEQLIAELPLKGKMLQRLSGMVDARFAERLRRVCKIQQIVPDAELDLCLYAAEIFGDGALALSGTGSHARLRLDGSFHGVGGYGALISDEGSGYWIGREALNAAILDDQQRGPATALTAMILRTFGKESDSLDRTLFRFYEAGASPASRVASCCRLVSQAADEGDAVAIDILHRAGHGLAEQTAAALRRYAPDRDLPLTAAGSVWRANAAFARAFADTLHDTYPEKTIVIPRFEPIVGAVLKHYYDQNGPLTDEVRHRFIDQFSPYHFVVSPETLSIPGIIQQ